MANVIISGRAAKGLRPTGSFMLNAGSWQAMGLVAWYPMEPNLLASQRSVPLLTTNNAVSLASATTLGGTCGSYDGSTSNLQKAQGASIAPWGGPFTVAGWFNPASVSGDRQVWSFIDSSFFGYYLYPSGTTPSFQVYNGTALTVTASATVVTNTWQHITGVEASTSLHSVYYNGTTKGSSTTTKAIPGGYAPSTNFESIGCYNQGGGRSNFFSGLIGDVRVYNRALSDIEVAMLYDPATRWDLYWQPNRRTYVFLSSSAGYLLVKN